MRGMISIAQWDGDPTMMTFKDMLGVFTTCHLQVLATNQTTEYLPAPASLGLST